MVCGIWMKGIIGMLVVVLEVNSMSKRNFILLIIILSLVIALVVLFLYMQPRGDTSGVPDSGGTNFLSRFNPFRKDNTPPSNPDKDLPPINIDGEVIIPDSPIPKLRKISTMPIAGYGIFSKERFKEIPIIELTLDQNNPSPTLPKGEGKTATPPAPPENTTTEKKKTPASLTPPMPPTPKPTEFTEAVRYVARSDGSIYQTFLDKISERKFSLPTIPKVYEAYFGNHGQTVILRYLKIYGDTISTFVGNLPKEIVSETETGDKEIKGTFLPDNVQDISISPDTLKAFYLFTNGNTSGENIIGTILNLVDNKKVQIFDSDFTEWLSLWPNDKLITLTTKADSRATGHVYTMDPNKKNPTRALGDINGLTTLSGPDGKIILFSGTDLALNAYQTDTRNSILLGVRTLPEKCVWNKIGDNIYCAVPKVIPSGQYPETWYQGEVSFSDELWKINIKTGNATILADPILAGEEIDGIKLAIDENENYLLFVNKKDSYLWKLDLK